MPSATALAIEEVGPQDAGHRVRAPPDFEAEPGQFALVEAPIDGELETGYYTLSSPVVGKTFEISR